MREASVDKVAILVGVIKPVLLRVQQYFERGLVIRSIPVAKNGYELLKPPTVARDLLERYAEEASTYENALVVVAPYCRVHNDVTDSIDTLAEVGARIVRMKQGIEGCPELRGRMDATFQEALVKTIVAQLAAFFFDPTEENTVAFELLRGLVSHDKMGPNNHSHERRSLEAQRRWSSAKSATQDREATHGQGNSGPQEEQVTRRHRVGLLDRQPRSGVC